MDPSTIAEAEAQLKKYLELADKCARRASEAKARRDADSYRSWEKDWRARARDLETRVIPRLLGKAVRS